MKIDFKIWEWIFYHLFWIKYSHVNFKFLYGNSLIALGFQLRNKYFWKFSKRIIYSSRQLLFFLSALNYLKILSERGPLQLID